MRKYSLLLITLLLLLATGSAQKYIKVSGKKINHIDNKNRKQGEWLFYDTTGNLKVRTIYKNDKAITPIEFYNNGVIEFERLDISDSTASFILYDKGKKFLGEIVAKQNGSVIAELEPNPLINDSILEKVKNYKNFELYPYYYYEGLSMKDFKIAFFSSSRFIFNKPLNVVLTINSIGKIIEVNFPKEINDLTIEEEKELRWMYITMPRWQPFFNRSNTKQVKMLLSNNMKLSFF